MTFSPFKFFSKNKQGRDFVVGDIHGMFSFFESQLEQLDFDPEIDRVFSVGDLIDRGPESYRVMEFLDKPWFYSIKGNHETMLINAKQDEDTHKRWIKHNGGAWWNAIDEATQEKIYKRLKSLSIAFEVATDIGNVGIVHADIPVGLSWKEIVKALNHDKELEDYLLWSRNRYKYIKLTNETLPVDGIDLVVMGHTPIEKPLHIENLYYIDTGAAYINDNDFGYLTLLQIQPTLAVYQYPAV